jgi:hypothetical protein
MRDPAPLVGPGIKGSCGIQKDWAKILETYNLGTYPEEPKHCSDE